MKVTYVDHMGSDLSVVNAARVSFNKKSHWEGRVGGPNVLSERDAKLIKYLAKHNHWTPFGHTTITVHVKAPIFVARQLGKHQVGLVWNEVSRRYVDDEPEFYTPEVWRGRSKDKKQGSEGTVDLGLFNTEGAKYEGFFGEMPLDEAVFESEKDLVGLYEALILAGVAPEQARMVLPQSTYTEWYWTGSLYAFYNVWKLRSSEDTQEETREVANQLFTIMETLFPVAWKELTQ